jgi:hypothetical protein
LSAHQEADGGGKDPDRQKSASGREAAKNRPELGGACRHPPKRKRYRGGEEHRGRKNENANCQPCLCPKPYDEIVLHSSEHLRPSAKLRESGAGSLQMNMAA